MAELTKIDKLKLEKLLGMGDGYVLDFSNRTFEDFVLESVGIDIYDDKYNFSSGSKANRLRALWKLENPKVVAKLLEDLHEWWFHNRYAEGEIIDQEDDALCRGYFQVLEKLKSEYDGEEIEIFEKFEDQDNFDELSKSIKHYMKENKPSLALDRLHTFIIRYLRKLGHKYNYPHDSEVPLHSLMGAYIKAIKKDRTINQNTERILKTSISILEAFNDVRNNSSYAHDNTILESNESRYIVSSISILIHFIHALESQKEHVPSADGNWDDDIPF